jgi:hypothetical protein
VDYLSAVLNSIASQLPLPANAAFQATHHQKSYQPVDPFGEGVVQVVIVNSNKGGKAHEAFNRAHATFGTFPGFVFLPKPATSSTTTTTGSQEKNRRLVEQKYSLRDSNTTRVMNGRAVVSTSNWRKLLSTPGAVLSQTRDVISALKTAVVV